jgi:hypothetical protein
VTERAPEVSAEEHRALWLDVIRWPLKGGMLGGVILLTLLAYVSAHFEGGWATWVRDQRTYVQGVALVLAVLVLARYAWRALVCTYPEERPVPWGPDPQDDTPVATSTGTFVAVAFFAFLPLAVWLSLRMAIEPAAWVDWLVVVAALAYAGCTLPLGLAGTLARGSVFAALPGPVWRMRRAEPRAARIASTTGVVFVGAFLLSFVLAAALVKPPRADALPGDVPRGGEPQAVAPAVVALLFVLRAAGFHAALVSFRVAGLLVREVPEVREAAR